MAHTSQQDLVERVARAHLADPISPEITPEVPDKTTDDSRPQDERRKPTSQRQRRHVQVLVNDAALLAVIGIIESGEYSSVSAYCRALIERDLLARHLITTPTTNDIANQNEDATDHSPGLAASMPSED